MDTNKMREQFEAWYAVEHPSRIKTLRWEPEYQSYRQQFDACMFSSWQASREAVMVELPDRDVEQCAYSLGFNSCLKQSRAAIEAQGLKVAP